MNAPAEPAGLTPRAAMRVWLWWIAASAVSAAMGLLIWVRQLGGMTPAQGAYLPITMLLLLAAAPAVLQGLVMRRLAGWPGFVAWVWASWLAAVGGTIVWFGLKLPIFMPEQAFDRIVATGGSLMSAPLWIALALAAVVKALLYQMLPILVLGLETRRRSRAFVVATVAGACAATLLLKLYSVVFHPDVRSLYSLYAPSLLYYHPQVYWPAFAQSLATLAVFGMIEGAISGFGLVRMFESPAEARAEEGRIGAGMALRVFGFVALVALAAHLARSAMGPRGYPPGNLERLISNSPVIDSRRYGS